MPVAPTSVEQQRQRKADSFRAHFGGRMKSPTNELDTENERKEGSRLVSQRLICTTGWTNTLFPRTGKPGHRVRGSAVWDPRHPGGITHEAVRLQSLKLAGRTRARDSLSSRFGSHIPEGPAKPALAHTSQHAHGNTGLGSRGPLIDHPRPQSKVAERAAELSEEESGKAVPGASGHEGWVCGTVYGRHQSISGVMFPRGKEAEACTEERLSGSLPYLLQLSHSSFFWKISP